MMSTRRLWRHLTTHCEPAFAALKQAFGNRYIYAGAGASLQSGSSAAAGERRGERPALEEDDLATYRKLARRETRSAFAREVRNDSSSHVASVLGAACPGPQIGVKRQVSGGAQGCRRMGEHRSGSSFFAPGVPRGKAGQSYAGPPSAADERGHSCERSP
jgi:hypothetical protein